VRLNRELPDGLAMESPPAPFATSSLSIGDRVDGQHPDFAAIR